MSLSSQAKAFRKAFGQEMSENISRYGFIKKKLWDMQVELILKNRLSLFKLLTNAMQTLRTLIAEWISSKNCLTLCLFAISLLLLLILIWTRLWTLFMSQI